MNSITPTGFARDRQLHQSRDDWTCPFISPPLLFLAPLSLSLPSSRSILTTQPFSHNSNYLHRALISGNLLFPSRDKKILRKKSTFSSPSSDNTRGLLVSSISSFFFSFFPLFVYPFLFPFPPPPDTSSAVESLDSHPIFDGEQV